MARRAFRGEAAAGRRRDHDQALADGLRPGCVALTALFVVFAGWHAVEFGLEVARVMVPLAAATAALAAGAAVALTRRRLPPGQAHLLAAALALAAYLNCVVQLALTGELQLTVNVLLLIVGIGVCLVDPAWVAGLCGALAVSWLVAVAAYIPATAMSRTVSDLIIALVVATMANVLRRRTLARLLQAQAALRELSERDELTGLLNRRGFLDAARRRLATGGPVSLWFLDVDGLKAVNDEHGHDVGDRLLLQVADVLREVFDGDVVARLSGDEFAVVQDDVPVLQRLRLRQRLDEALATASAATGLPVAVSTGTAVSRPGQGLSELLAAADAAMYQAKARRQSPGTGVAASITL